MWTAWASACFTTLVKSSRAVASSSPSADVRQLSSHDVGLNGAGKSTTFARRANKVAKRGEKSRLIEHRRVELSHHGSEHMRRLAQRVVDPVERRGVGCAPRLVEVLACRQDVLERTVMQVLGERPAFSVLDRRQLGDQLVAVHHETPDREHARPGHPGQQDAADTDAGQ